MGTSTKIKTFLLLLFICTSVVRAQQEIIGLVTDKEDGMPISGVQIIIKDTIKNTIVKFTQTDGEGRFSIHQDRKDTSHCLLCLSMLGYKPWQYSLKDGKQNFQIKLVPSIIQIKEVTVKAQKIREAGDTLIYTVSAFADVQDKTIGDVLQKMPGIDVSATGKISYNGVSINKFYIEGRDLLEGKYGLATNGISPADVGAVEILENHQPIKALQDVSFSSQAAVNLRLKDKSKAKWVMNLLAGGGISTHPDKGLWSGELFAMQMKKEWQNITLYKTNNTGKNLETEVNDFIAGKDPVKLEDYINVGNVSVPYLEKGRTLFNRSHLFSTGWLWGLKNEWEIRSQINYLNDRSTAEAETSTTYYRSVQDRIIHEEKQSVTHTDQLTAHFSVEANKEAFYLKNNLKTSLSWNDINISMQEDASGIMQQASQSQYKVSNDLQLIKRPGKWLFSFTALNEGQWRPQSLRVEWGNTIRQRTKDRYFYTHEEANLGIQWGRLNISLAGGGSALFRDFDSSLEGLPDSLGTMINALTTNYQSLQLTPKLEYKRKRWEGKLEAPLQYYHYSFAHAATNKHVYLFSPSAYFRWHTTPKLYLFLRAGLSTDPCDLHSLYNGLVMTDYRTLSRGLNEYAAVKSRFLSGGFNYKNPVKGLFTHVMVMRSWDDSDKQYGRDFSDKYIIGYYTHHPTTSNNWTIMGTVTSNLDFLHGMAGINVMYINSEQSMISENDRTSFRTGSLHTTGRINGRIGEILNWQYRVSYGWNRLDADEQVNRKLEQWCHSFAMTVVPVTRVNVQLAGEYYRNEVSENIFKDIVLLDAKCSYTLTPHTELSATLMNVFNRKKYSYTIYGQLSSVEHYRRIRGREFLLNLYVKL
jgi:hypothetical protein